VAKEAVGAPRSPTKYAACARPLPDRSAVVPAILPTDTAAVEMTMKVAKSGVSEADVGVLLGHGARSTARGSYISPDLLRPRLEHLRRLPLPERVQLQAKLIEVPATEPAAKVITLPVGRSRA
jgi:hypothetical protein